MWGISGKTKGGDYPIFSRDQLPAAPSGRRLYDVLQSFLGATQRAYELGIPPPEAATPEEIWKWKAQESPRAEEQTLSDPTLPRLFNKRKETEDI
jgi:hypothetical protein